MWGQPPSAVHPAQLDDVCGPRDSYADPIKGPNGRLLDSSVRLKLDGGQVVGMEARGMSVPNFALQLSRQFGTPVQGKTGIAGHYDFSLKWTRDASAPEAEGGSAAYPARSGAAPSLFTAVQDQLGLKLEPQKHPWRFSSSISWRSWQNSSSAGHATRWMQKRREEESWKRPPRRLDVRVGQNLAALVGD